MWQTPKTDWKASDFMNIEDYNRIKNNLNELRDMSRELWKEFPLRRWVRIRRIQITDFTLMRSTGLRQMWTISVKEHTRLMWECGKPIRITSRSSHGRS